MLLFDDLLSQRLEKMRKYTRLGCEGNIVFNLETLQHDINNLKENINGIISNSDKTDLLCKISIRELFYTNQRYDRFVELGAFQFIIGLCLNDKNKSSFSRKPEDIDQLCNFIIDYVDLTTFELMAKSLIKEKALSNLNFTTQSYNMLNKVNYGGYQFQFDEYIELVYFPLSDLFQPLGVTPKEIVYFSNKIKEKIETGIESILKAIRDLYKDNKQQYQKHKKDFEAQTNLNSQQTEARLLAYCNLQLHSRLWDNITNILIFKPRDIVSEIDSNYSKFKAFLNLVSSKFGDHNNRYCNLHDHNIIFEKPVIDLLDGKGIYALN